MLEFSVKKFENLSTNELYELLQLRAEVFVVEQNCVYQDIDGKDQKAIHILGYFENQLVAYCRIFDKKAYFADASIGRVIVKENYRNKKWGNLLLKKAIESIDFYYSQTAITISAQLYLKTFYENHGFQQSSDTYLEDGIPHIEMKIEFQTDSLSQTIKIK